MSASLPSRSLRPAVLALALLSLPAPGAGAGILDLPFASPSAERPAGPDLTGRDRAGGASALPAPVARAPRGAAGTPPRADMLDAAPTWTVESNAANQLMGRSAVTAGDVNGDGHSDIVALGGSSHDQLYLFLGSPSGPTLAPGYPLSQSPYGGGMVNAAGDLNGDGYDDVVLAWPSASSGRIRVYYGNAGGLDTGSPFNYFQNFATLWAQWAGPAGDVNGDGYGDPLVASPNEGPNISLCGSAGSGHGRVEVFYGSATGISTFNWLLWGCQWVPSAGGLGAGAGAAGDVNADGYDDIVIGAPGAAPPGLGSVGGSAWVVYGSATGLPLFPGYTNLGTLSGATRLDSPTALAGFGDAACTAGDVNGDGYADVAIGSPYDDTYASDGGYVRVFAGGPSGVTTTLLYSESSLIANARMGRTLAPAGDLNGDGRGDLLIGQTSSVLVAQSLSGSMLINRSLATTTPWDAGTAGDVNADGLSDVVLGETAFANGQAGEGRIAVYAGRGDGPSTVWNWKFETLLENPNLGWSVASAGDVNGDGADDVLIGAPTWDNFSVPGETDNGIVFLMYGGLLSGLPSSYSWYYFGAPGDQVGVAVSGLGDVNGDGYADFAVGAHQPATGSGKVLVFHGGPGLASGVPSQVLTGPQVGSYFGGAVTGGDFNGDGYADLAVGAPGYDLTGPASQSDAGAAYAFLGSAAGIAASHAWSGVGGQFDERLGSSLNGFADINADGYTDLVIGSPGLDTGSPPFLVVNSGRITEWYGGPGATPLTFRQSILGTSNESFGSSVANAGDVDGDGYGDIVVGAPNANPTISGQGRAAVHRGSASGLIATPHWSQLGGEAFAAFGSAVAGAGDVDGDGLSDVLVGAVFEDAGGAQDRGTARIYRGPLPAGAAAFWTAYGPGAFANMGHALANAGDVDGDGWPEVLCGEPGYSFDLWRQGRVETFMGGWDDARLGLALARRTTSGPNIVPMGTAAPGVEPVILHYGASAAGRAPFRLESEVRTPVGFTPVNLSWISPAWSPGLAGGTLGYLGAGYIPVPGVQTGVPYWWRTRSRFRNVYFPTSRWASPSRSGVREYDLRGPGTTWVGVDDPALAPAGLALSAPRPNPSSGPTSIAYTLPRSGAVALDVLDLQGRRVRTLVEGARPAGTHLAAWDGRDDGGRAVAAGVYFFRLRAAGEAATRRVVVVH
uniref:T9SS type A sorting domain-containing protein n=1 Tax=Eiseniibacteriota bacterium TaxID=2212470 RepID=A0A832I5B2_UNCEI